MDSCFQPHISLKLCVHVHVTAPPGGPTRFNWGMIAGQVEEGLAWGETSGQGSRQEGTTRIQARGDADSGHQGY